MIGKFILIGYTLAMANGIIMVLIIIVIALVVAGCYSIRYNRILRQRNVQLQRILRALDDYREQTAEVKVLPQKDEHNFFVMMDSRVNKEKPFTDPDFDHAALVKFMGVSEKEFCHLAPRYKDANRTLDYINSLRAEYAAKVLMEHSDYSAEKMTSMCGFRTVAAYNSAFKFAFGITPTDYLNGMKQMFKKRL